MRWSSGVEVHEEVAGLLLELGAVEAGDVGDQVGDDATGRAFRDVGGVFLVLEELCDDDFEPLVLVRERIVRRAVTATPTSSSSNLGSRARGLA